MIILRMKRYIEKGMTGKDTPGTDDFFIKEDNQSVSKEPTWTLIMVPNVTYIFVMIDEDGGRANTTKRL